MAIQWTMTGYSNLYQATPRLSNENKRKLGLLVPVDVYVQDPLVAENDPALGLGTLEFECEPDLMAGPTSARITVVDYDGDRDWLEDPVQWDRKARKFYFKPGSEKDRVAKKPGGEREYVTKKHRDTHQFHQVNVWAIVQSVLGMYEATWVLGRSAPWAFEGNRLTVVPHAGYLANAFYDRRSKSLQFYYFGPDSRRVYTCLSHDIVAHETGHAILDGLRPRYFEDSSMQTTAFHEFVADMTAILSSLLKNELRWEVAAEAGEDLSKDNLIAALAKEFGHYATGRPHLRSALNPNTMESVQNSSSPYDWAQVLTGAMWDMLSGMFAYYRQRPKSNGKLPTSKEAILWAANRFRRVAFQPLDYLPPVDVQFSDYARAVLQADEVVDPVDEDGYRDIIKRAFDGRGIKYDVGEGEPQRIYFYTYDIERIARSRTDAYHFLNENRRQLCIPAQQDISVANLYQTDKTIMGRGKLHREIVLQYVWSEDVQLKGKQFGPLEGELVALHCGGTLVFDDRGNVRSWIRKPGASMQRVSGGRRRSYCRQEQEKGKAREKQLLAYLASRFGSGYVGLYEGGRPDEIEARPPVVAQRGGDGRLRLEVTPHLRHWTGAQGGKDGR